MSLAEMLTIMIIYHLSPAREFKYFYLYFLPQKHGKNFPNLLSYNRFVEIMPNLLLPLITMLHCMSGKKDDIYFIDSTKLQICHNKRTNSNRVFKGMATMGRSSYGWFMGFKLHLIINSKGQIISVKITQGNVDDRAPVQQLTKGLSVALYTAIKAIFLKNYLEKFIAMVFVLLYHFQKINTHSTNIFKFGFKAKLYRDTASFKAKN